MSNKLKYLYISIFLILFLESNSQINWQPINLDFNRHIWKLFEDSVTDQLFIGGQFSKINDSTYMGIASWNGNELTGLGCGVDWICSEPVPNNSGPHPVKAITRYRDDIIVAGSMVIVDTIEVNSIAAWNGVSWKALGAGITSENGNPGAVQDLLVHNDTLYAAGMFDFAGEDSCNCLALWDGNSWSNVGDFLNYDPMTTSTNIYCMAWYKDELYVAGVIQDSLDQPINILRWNGTEWRSVGNGIPGTMSIVYCMSIYNDELYVGGTFKQEWGNQNDYIQKWDGQNWHGVRGGMASSIGAWTPVRDMEVYNNQLWVYGNFDIAGGVPAKQIAVWDGSKWCGIGTNFTWPIMDMNVYQNEIYIAGNRNEIDSIEYPAMMKWIGGDYRDTCQSENNIVFNNIENELKIYPNPIINRFNISSTAPIDKVQIFNRLGLMIVIDRHISNDYSFDMSSFSAGIYFVRIYLKSIPYTYKMVLL